MTRVASLPDVVSVAAVSGRPLGPEHRDGHRGCDRPDVSDSAVPWATWRLVRPTTSRPGSSPDRRTGIHRHRADRQPWRVVISHRMASLLWPGQNPNRPVPRFSGKAKTKSAGKSSASSATCVSAVSRATRPSPSISRRAGARRRRCSSSSTRKDRRRRRCGHPHGGRPASDRTARVERAHARRDGEPRRSRRADHDAVARGVCGARARPWRSRACTACWPTRSRGAPPRSALRIALGAEHHRVLRPGGGAGDAPGHLRRGDRRLAAAFWLSQLMSTLLFASHARSRDLRDRPPPCSSASRPGLLHRRGASCAWTPRSRCAPSSVRNFDDMPRVTLSPSCLAIVLRNCTTAACL